MKHKILKHIINPTRGLGSLNRRLEFIVPYLVLLGISITAFLFLFGGNYTYKSKDFGTLVANDKEKIITRFESGGAGVEFEFEAPDAKQIVNGDVRTYEISENTSIEYEILKDGTKKGLKETIILKDTGAPRTYRFNMTLSDIEKHIKDENGYWRFYNRQGREVFHIPPGDMIDAKGARSMGVDIDIKKEGENSFGLLIKANDLWLDNPERAWPVRVDPSIIVSGGIDETEAQFGGLQRKTEYVNGYWYTVYDDGGKVYYKKSKDGIGWSSAVDLDTADSDNYSPSIAKHNDTIYISWIDDSGEAIEAVGLNTKSGVAGTKCASSSLGTIGSTFMTSTAVTTDGTVYVAYSDTAGSPDTEYGVFKVTYSGCSFTDIDSSGATENIDADYDAYVYTAKDETDNVIYLQQGSPNVRSLFRFPLTNIPSGATITDVDFQGNITEENIEGSDTVNINAYNSDGQSDPDPDVAATAFSRAAGTTLASFTTPFQSLGSTTVDLGTTADSQVEAAKDAVDFYAIGFTETNFSTEWITLEAIEDAGSDPATLIVSYTVSGASGLTAGDRPVLVASGSAVNMIFQDGNLSHSAYNGSSWTTVDSTISSTTDNIYSATGDSSNIWLLTSDSSSDTEFYSFNGSQWNAGTAPFTSQTNPTSVSLTYDVGYSSLYASVIKDASEQAYWKVTPAGTTSWSSETSYGFAPGDLGHISSPSTVSNKNQVGVVLRQGSDLEFAAVVTPTDPVAYWKLDDSTGTTAKDSTSSRLDGTLTNFAAVATASSGWATEDMCISGKCLSFDGIDDFVNASNGDLSVKSISFWAKPASSSASFLQLSSSTYVRASSGTVLTSGFMSPSVYVNGVVNGTINANQWNHIAVTTATAIDTGNIGLGRIGTFGYHVGFLDEIKIYPYQRSASQVAADYASRGSGGEGSGGVLGASNQNQPNVLSNGLVGYWKMDDTALSSDCSTDTIMDSSGLNYHGKACPMMQVDSSSQSGSFGPGDTSWSHTTSGSDKVLYVALRVPTDLWTVNSVTYAGVSMTSISTLTYATNRDLRVYRLLNPAAGTNTVAIDITAGSGTSQAMAISFKGVSQTDTNTAVVTNSGATNGSMSVNIPGYSSDQIVLALASWTNVNTLTAALGETVYRGTTTRAAAVTEPGSFGTHSITSSVTGGTDPWGYAGFSLNTAGVATTSGKFGTAAEFDGNDDYIQVTDVSNLRITDKLTISAWVRVPSGINKDMYVLTKTGYSLWLRASPTGFIQFRTLHSGVEDNLSSDTLDIRDDTWHHILITFDASLQSGNKKIYLDGVLRGQSDQKTVMDSSNNNLWIGSSNTGDYWQGRLDEVKIYNRALTSAEAFQLYNWAPGAVAYWSFEDRIGSSLSDTSTSGYTGTWAGVLGNQWKIGKFGGGGYFNGTNNTVNVGDIQHLGRAATFSVWVKIDTLSGNDRSFISKRDVGGSATEWQFGLKNTNRFKFSFASSASNCCTDYTEDTTTLVTGKWYHVAAVFDDDANTLNWYVNGVNTETDSVTQSFGNNTSTNASIGSTMEGAFEYFHGTIDELKIFNYARNSKQIVSDFNAGHPNVGSPIASPLVHLKFDDGFGNVASNSGSMSTGNARLINIANPATTGSGWNQNGKFGRALAFDGVNDYTDIPNDTAFNFTTYSLSSWVNIGNMTASDEHFVISRYNWGSNTGYGMMVESDGRVRCDFNGSSGQFTSTNSYITAQKWYYIACVFDGSTLKIYVNGQLKESASRSSLSNATTYNLYFGTPANDPGHNTYSLSGLIDEAKVYNYALTESEIKLDYNRQSGLVLGALSDTSQLTGGSVASNSASAEYCVPGASDVCAPPIARWDFEEGSGTKLNDKSGYGNNGTWGGSLGSQWVPGKIGKAGRFNGSNWVNAPDADILDTGDTITYEAWVKLQSTATDFVIIDKQNNSVQLAYDGTNKRFRMNVSNLGGNVAYSSRQTLDTTKFHHVAITKSGTARKVYLDGEDVTVLGTNQTALNTSTSISIGRNSAGITSEYANAIFDEIRVYNYVRTPAQIAWDYNRGAPIAHYKLDECQGNYANNSSATSSGVMRGTLTIGASGSQTTAGSCSSPTDGTGAWYNGLSGKFNYSLSFDGTDDYVQIPGLLGNPRNISLSAWVNLTGVDTTGSEVISLGDHVALRVDDPPTATDGVAGFFYNGSGWDATETGVAIEDTGWHHVAYTVDDDNNVQRVYIDGILRSSSSHTGSISYSGLGSNTSIGRHGNGSGDHDFAGKIDDVRVYNYPLTASQIKTVYNQGSAVRFGPSTGAPQ